MKWKSQYRKAIAKRRATRKANSSVKRVGDWIRNKLKARRNRKEAQTLLEEKARRKRLLKHRGSKSYPWADGQVRRQDVFSNRSLTIAFETVDECRALNKYRRRVGQPVLELDWADRVADWKDKQKARAA